jgi:hypothetical protein
MWLLKRFARWILREEIQSHVNALVKVERKFEQFLDDHTPTFGFPGSENKPNLDKTPKTTRLSSFSKSSGCSRGRSRGEDDAFKLHKQALVIEGLGEIARVAHKVNNIWETFNAYSDAPGPLVRALNELEDVFIEGDDYG